MRKIKSVLCISFLLVLSACQSKIIQEVPTEQQKDEEVSLQLDRITANYTIEEVLLPDELQFPADSLLIFELMQSEGFQFKVSIIDPLKSRPYSTINVYDYDLLANEIVSHPITMEIDEFRLHDYSKDELGGYYELLSFPVGENHYQNVFYNGKIVEGLPNNIANPFMGRGFQKLKNKIYILIEVKTDIPNKSIWTIYELNEGKASEVYQLDNERFIKADELGNGSMLVIPPIQINSKERMAFAIGRDNQKIAQVFDGYELLEFPLDEYPISMIPLKDYVLFFNQVVVDESQDIVEFPLYKYEIKTKEITLVETLDIELGKTYHTQGNEFYQVTANSQHSIGVCKMDDQKFKCREFEEFSNNDYVSTIETLDEKTDLVYMRGIGANQSQLYLIHWEID